MSSVLKALKNQSSPLLQTSSDVALQSAKMPQSRSVLTFILALIVAAATAVGAWFLMQGLMPTAKPINSTAELPQPQPSYQLGDIAAVITPQWPVPVIPETTTELTTIESQQPVLSVAQQQAQNSVVNSNQAIDLSQVSPELLSAFESALNETSNTGDNQKTASVVPLLTQLNLNFQRTVPSFSYDGHQYSSRPQSRWVELSGVRLFEGERFQGLTVITIAPAHIVLAKDNQAFQQPALEDWTKP